MTLSPEGLLWWFRERLVRAVSLRLDKYAGNPLWVVPDGTQTLVETRPTTPQDYRDFATMLENLSQPNRPGRKRGWRALPRKEFLARYTPSSYQDLREFLDREPTKLEYANHIDLTERTLDRYIAENELSYPPT